MKTVTRWMCALLLADSALAAAPVTVPGPERLPADTWILVNWHGVANANQVRNTNPVMQLWNDPQFASAREQIATTFATSVGRGTTRADVRAVIDDALSVLENPAVLGITGEPLANGKDSVHMYVVLNKRGKETSWTRLQSRRRPNPVAQITTYTFHGTQIKKTVTTSAPKPVADGAKTAPPSQPKISYNFEASLGDYELYSDNQSVMEALVTRLQDGTTTADSLLKNPAYQRAQRFRAERPLLEAFVKIPDLSKLPIPPTPQFNTQAVIRELHFERFQGLWFSAGMGRDRMTVRAALLGDMAPGSVLDLLGGNSTEFQTAAVAPASESFGAFRLDLPALYETVMRAVKAGLPADRAPAVGIMVESTVVAQTGLRPTELLALFSGEIGAATTGDESLNPGELPALVMLPVTNGERLLALLHSLPGPLFLNEEKVSAATVVKLGPLPAIASAKTGAKQNAPFHLAVSPSMLMISPDRTQLDAALARNATGGSRPAGSLAADAKYQAVRKTLPPALNGISYTDYSRMKWEAFIAAAQQRLTTTRQQALDRAERAEKGEGETPPDPARAAQLRNQAEDADQFAKILVDLLPLAKKHLKISAGGSWKASDGVFFDSYTN